MAPTTPVGGVTDNSGTSIHIMELQRDTMLARIKDDVSNLAQYDNLSLFKLEVKLSLLERQFESFDKAQSKLESMDESQIELNHRLEFESAYFEIKSLFLERMSLLRVNVTNVNADPLMSSTRVMSSVIQPTMRPNLPTIPLPKFSGNYSDWTDFYNMFCDRVHNNSEVPVVSKFHYLRSCLTDNAAKLIQSLEVSPDNYREAWNLLKLRYDNKRYIFQSHIESIFAIKSFDKPTVEVVRDFIDSVNANLRALQSIATKDQIADGIMLYMMVSSLDPKTQAKWEEEICTDWDETTSSDTLNFPEWKDLAFFLERRCKTLDIIAKNGDQSAGTLGRSSASQQSSSSRRRAASSFTATKQTTCRFCNATPTHSVFSCSKFTEMNVSDRFRTVKRLNLCLNCLGANHIATMCPSKYACQQCKASHHTLLHKDNSSAKALHQPTLAATAGNVSPISPPEEPQPEAGISLQVSKDESQVILGTAKVELQAPNGRSIIVRALLDSASQLNFITEHVAQYLRLPRSKVNMEITGIGKSSTKAHNTGDIIIKSITTEFSFPITAVVIPSITSYQPQTSINTRDWDIPGNVKLADKEFNVPGPIDLLIGASWFYNLLLVGQIKTKKIPMLQRTKLGWIVSGSIESSQADVINKTRTKSSGLPSSHVTSSRTVDQSGEQNTKSNKTPKADLFTFSCMHIASTPSYKDLRESTDPLLENFLERFWVIENCPSETKLQLTREETECERFFEETTIRCPKTNKFIVRLPFKTEPTNLGSSEDIASRRFYSLERKLCRNDNIGREYRAFIREYIDLKHMIQVSSAAISSCNYIPHHCVIKPDSSTTKLRVVFDASCRTSNGTSLNEMLRVGPTLQDDISTILMRFRFHKYVLVADIAKMYRQVLVDDRDIKWQSILWRDSPQDQLSTYQLKTVTYGTSSAPYLAVKCLQVLANEEKSRFPIGCRVTSRDFYVDNLMTGGNSVEEVVEIKRQVVDLLNQGGFPLRKFAANCDDIIADIPLSERDDIIKVDDTEYIKTLGLKWSPNEDTFGYSYNMDSGSKKRVTKRAILSHTAKLFDPLGLVNPIIVRCKMLLQSIWSMKLHWDESVPQDIIVQWEDIHQQLMTITEIKLPRFVNINITTNIHAFADASTKAYGACVYAVTTTFNGSNSSLICSKSRVAPLKPLSLPRLELCAALLLSELLKFVLSTLPISPSNVTCWSDSTITLHWIAGEPSRWNTFVSNRVVKIQQNTNATWRHVPSELNPADILSRGTTISNLNNNKFWFNGPEYLTRDRKFWPSDSLTMPDASLCEVRKKFTTLVGIPVTDLIYKHKYVNSYDKMIRIFAYVCRLMDWLTVQKVTKGPVEVEETKRAFELICRIIQRHYFSSEIHCIITNKQIPRQSKLVQLSPFLYDGLIRVGGRLKNAAMPFSAKHPIVLPSTHPFTHTIIRHYHHQHLHAGALTLHNILRENLWILNGRRTIRQVTHNCVMCYRTRPITQNQIMGQLPSDRVSPTFPFAVSGVDYCGPFQFTHKIRGRSPIKVYIAVFICFSVKAVHFELVPDLTTDAFIAALKRFIARRGRCTTIYSDNATNFVGANRELRDLLQSFLSETHNQLVKDSCLQLGVEWKFIPPRSPHFGGLWESAVKNAKYYLRRAVGNHVLTFDELHTACCQAEAIVNSRPLTPISSDPNDLRPLTPAHFLVGRPLTTILEPSATNINPFSLKKYHILRWIHQQFWDRWRNEYLKTLQQRNKWNTVQPNIQLNDLVLLEEESTPPLKWPLARVIEILPGKDGKVRVVVVKTGDGTFKRAITRLCKIPIETTYNNVESNAFKGGEC